jgi:uncharacterized protein
MDTTKKTIVKKPLSSILIKPAGPDCNLNCTYCFYNDNKPLYEDGKKHRMSFETLDMIIRQIMGQSEKHVSIGWQGGEPSLMGLEFFKKAVNLQMRYGQGQMVGNGFQTNGTLLTAEWAKFFNRYNFLVGLSIDGPHHIHDHYRISHTEKNTFTKVYDRLKMLLDYDVAVNALTVVNDYSVQFPEEIYQFHKACGLKYMQFIPCVETDLPQLSQAAPFSVSSDRYGTFLCRLFDLWLSDFSGGRPTTSIRFFDSVFHHYVQATPPDCLLLPECGVYVVIEYNGDVYPCDFFVEKKWKLGNIKDKSIISMLNSQKQADFGLMKSKCHRICDKCEWFLYCYGGCIKDRIRDPQDQNQNHFCNAFKTFFEHADSIFHSLAEDWKNQKR